MSDTQDQLRARAMTTELRRADRAMLRAFATLQRLRTGPVTREAVWGVVDISVALEGVLGRPEKMHPPEAPSLHALDAMTRSALADAPA